MTDGWEIQSKYPETEIVMNMTSVDIVELFNRVRHSLFVPCALRLGVNSSLATSSMLDENE